MNNYICTQADKDKFAIYHTIYTDSNLFMRFNWNDHLNKLTSNKNGYFLFFGDTLIGGFTLLDDKIGHPFIVPPFNDRCLLWKIIIDYAVQTTCKEQFYLADLSEIDAEILIKHFSASIQTIQRVMLRPTAPNTALLDETFYFAEPLSEDIPHIIQTVFEAHSSGYTSTIKKRTKAEVKEAISLRFQAFSKTNSSYLSTLVKRKDTHALVGACIAGIYPDSPNNFSTIHQVSVLPTYQRRGIAEAMMLRSINLAHTLSPVITLGVMVGNPAEQLYTNLGFSSGPNYYNLSLNYSN